MYLLNGSSYRGHSPLTVPLREREYPEHQDYLLASMLLLRMLVLRVITLQETVSRLLADCQQLLSRLLAIGLPIRIACKDGLHE